MEQWEKNYYITSIAGANNGSSLVVMSKGQLALDLKLWFIKALFLLESELYPYCSLLMIRVHVIKLEFFYYHHCDHQYFILLSRLKYNLV